LSGSVSSASRKLGDFSVQSARDPLVRFFAAAFALQFLRIERLAKHHTNRMWTGEKFSDGQSLACSVNENGNYACGKFFQ
jgi:hypothetical protein